MVGSEADYKLDDKTDLFSEVLALDANQNYEQQKKDLKTSQSDGAKQAKLCNEIFDYIHIARCHRLFFLAWYNDLTYTQSEDGSSPKILPTSCCNGPSCNSVELGYFQQKPFIDTTTAKVTKVD